MTRPSVPIGIRSIWGASGGAVTPAHAIAELVVQIAAEAAVEHSRAAATSSEPTEDDMSLASLAAQLTALSELVAENTAALQAGGLVGPPYVDLRLGPYSVVRNDSTKGAVNRVAINAALVAYGVSGAQLTLPAGTITVDREPSHDYSIKFDRTTEVELVGQGERATTIVQEGNGTNGDWHCIVMEATTRCGLRNLRIMQGTITNPAPGQHQHLVYVRSQTVGVDNTDTTITDCDFGKCVGDAITMLGGQASDGFGVVRGLWIRNVRMRLNGNVDGVRIGARTGISFQRGYSNVRIENVDIYGAQNSCIDMESTAGTTTTMEWAQFADVRCDATFAKSSVAVSFSGISNGQKTQHLRAKNVTIIGGRMQVVSTSDAVFEGCTVYSDDTLGTGLELAGGLCYVRQVNDDLVFRNMHIERIGLSQAGECLDIASTGNRLTIDGGSFIQGTNQHAIRIENTTKIQMSGMPRILHSGSAPTNFSGMFVGAITSSITGPVLEAHVECTSGSIRGGITLAVKNGFTISTPNARMVGRGGVTNGVYLSVETGGTLEPVKVDIDNGSGTPWKQVDANDVAITTQHVIVSGNRGGACTFVGDASPQGVLDALQGSWHIQRSGNSTVVRQKTTSGSSGWSILTIN